MGAGCFALAGSRAGAGLGLTCSCISTSVVVAKLGSEFARRRFCGLSSSGSCAVGVQGDAAGVGVSRSYSSKAASSNWESALRLGGRAWGWARVCGCGCCWSSWSIIRADGESLCAVPPPARPHLSFPFALTRCSGPPRASPTPSLPHFPKRLAPATTTRVVVPPPLLVGPTVVATTSPSIVTVAPRRRRRRLGEPRHGLRRHESRSPSRLIIHTCQHPPLPCDAGSARPIDQAAHRLCLPSDHTALPVISPLASDQTLSRPRTLHEPHTPHVCLAALPGRIPAGHLPHHATASRAARTAACAAAASLTSTAPRA